MLASFKNYTNGIKLLFAFIVVILLITVYQTSQVISSAKNLSNSQAVQLAAKKTVSLALSNESAFRAYILTGKNSFLQPQQQLQQQIYEQLGQLKSLTSKNQLQQIRADSIIMLANKRIEFSKHAILKYQSAGASTAMELVETGEGKIYIDHIRMLSDNMQDAENILLTKYKGNNDESVRNLQGFLFLTMAAILLLLAVFIKKIKADNIEKEIAATALTKANDELEQRVKDRTEELSKKEKRFRALVENNEGIITLIDEELAVLYSSDSTAHTTGRFLQENKKIALAKYLHPDDVHKTFTLMKEVIASPGKTIPIAFRVKHLHGHYIWLEGVVKNMLHDAAIAGIITNLRDITERKKAEQKIIKANRLYSFISHINQMIVHTRDEATLFKAACQIAVAEGKFRMAWIGMIDETTKILQPVMHAGDDSDYHFFITPTPLQHKGGSNSLIAAALLQEKYLVCNDIENDVVMAATKKEALQRGYHSVMALPIKKYGKVVGLFSFYTATKNFFDAQEIALLTEATNDVSFALEVFDKEVHRKNAVVKLKTAVERYDILARATSDTIWDWDIVHNTMLYNDGITNMLGYQASEVENVVDWWNEKIHPDDFKKVTELVEEVFEKGLQKFQINYRFRCADETYKYIFDRAYVQFDENGNPARMIGAMQDITYQVQEEMRTNKAIIDAQEQERNFIGGELHDNVNQILAGSVMALGMVKENTVGTKQAFEFIQMGKGHILSAIDELRKLSHKLAPASFDDSSLRNAFEDLLQTFNVNGQFNIKFNFDEGCNAVNGDIQINLYRILQEQIKNIVKYAEATVIEVAVTQRKSVVKMRIADNGKGFNVKTAKKGIGLSNIKKRAESFSGKFVVISAPGKGCEIKVELPIAV